MYGGFSSDVEGGGVQANWSGDYQGFGRAEIVVRAETGYELTYTAQFPDSRTKRETLRVSRRDWHDGLGHGSVIGDDELDDLERVADIVAAVTGNAAVFTGPENRQGRERIEERIGHRYDVRPSNVTRVEARDADLNAYTRTVSRVVPELHTRIAENGALQDAVDHLDTAYQKALDRSGLDAATG